MNNFKILKNGKKTKDYLLVIPVINEGSNIINLVSRIKKLQMDKKVNVLIVDGGSKDGSIEKLINESGINFIFQNHGNRKVSEQLQIGYKFAIDNSYLGIITIDGNNKDDPSFILDFIEHLKSGYDFVQGSRYVKGGKSINLPFSRKLLIKSIHVPIMNFFSNFHWTDTTQGFRGYSIKLIKNRNLDIFSKDLKNYELLIWTTLCSHDLGLKCIEIPTIRTYPKNKVNSKMKLGTKIIYFYSLLRLSLKKVRLIKEA